MFKRKPNHFIVYFLYKKEERFLYKLLSKLTHSVIGTTNDIDQIIGDIKKFVSKNKGLILKQINLTSYGTGYTLVMGVSNEDIVRIINELSPLTTKETKIMFTTCFSGASQRQLVEMSEYYGGMEMYGLISEYTLNAKMNKCKCKEKGFSEKLISKIPQSRYGFKHDEVTVVNTIRRDEGEEINWKRCGMAYEYNKILREEGICEEVEQPYTLLKSIRNYLFNIN